MFICGSIACQPTIKTSDADIKQIQYAELVAMMEQSRKPKEEGWLSFLDQKKTGPTVLIDVRPARYHERACIPESINIPLPHITEGLPELANARNIVVYANGWTDPLSPAAAKRLMALGYSNVFDFRGGIEYWKDQGGRLDSSVAPATQPAEP